MADATIPTGPIQIVGTAECIEKPGAVRLDGFPLLVFDGQAIKTEDNGTTVEDLTIAIAGSNRTYESIAAQFGTTANHVAEAIRYAVAAGYAQAAPPTQKDQ
jgi:uncharacterized protein (DUF433 family)